MDTHWHSARSDEERGLLALILLSQRWGKAIKKKNKIKSKNQRLPIR